LAQGRVPAATGIVKERAITDCCIGERRSGCQGGIRTDGGVSDAVKVAIKGERPIGRVFPAINVGKKGSGASGRIFFCEVKKQATGANGCVVPPGVMAAATSNQLPYCMCRLKAEERVLSLCCIATGIATIRRRTKRLNFWQKPKANE
jgi:hypothetical protein